MRPPSQLTQENLYSLFAHPSDMLCDTRQANDVRPSEFGIVEAGHSNARRIVIGAQFFHHPKGNHVVDADDGSRGVAGVEPSADCRSSARH
jgi:hypothetical protein